MSERHVAQPANIYRLKDCADAQILYQGWAATYDHDLLDRMAWKGHRAVAEMMANCSIPLDAAILDIGCGTGLCGQALYEKGFVKIVGLDLTRAMLMLAAIKSVSQSLLMADATKQLPLGDACFDVVCSAGLFSHGPVLPQHIELMLRPLKLNGIAIHTINGLAFDKLDYDRTLSRLTSDGVIEIISIQTIEYTVNADVPGKMVVLRHNKRA